MKAHFEGSIRALQAYKPQHIPETASPISCLAIWARDGVSENIDIDAQIVQERNATQDWLLLPRSSTEHGSNGWETLLPGVRCIVVGGNHFTIMRQPRVGFLSLSALYVANKNAC